MGRRLRHGVSPTVQKLESYFGLEIPTFWVAAVPCLVLAALLYTRAFGTNFIFDEQEALLANPYVNGKNLGFWDAIHRDFWGLAPERSVGSYRPLPNMLWRIIAEALRRGHALVSRIPLGPASIRGPFVLGPWIFHWANVVLHAANGALLACLVYHITRRRRIAWFSALIFTTCAVLTEAVSGIVGAADVLGGLGALLALAALRLPIWAMPFGAFAGLLVGFFSKESAIVCVPLVPLAALWLAPFTHPRRPLRAVRALLALTATMLACILYTTARKRWFPAPLPSELAAPLPDHASHIAKAFRSFLVWFHQPPLPKDPLNNPLVEADMPHRIAGALRVWFRGLGQLAFPRTLSGDYSFRAEPIPESVVFPQSILGALGMIGPIVLGVALWLRSLGFERRAALAEARGEILDSSSEPPLQPRRDVAEPPFQPRRDVVEPAPQLGDLSPHESFSQHQDGPAGSAARLRESAAVSALTAVGLVWLVVSYFPHSNIPLLLPTVRAERFLYFPALGSSVVLAAVFTIMLERPMRRRLRQSCLALVVAFFAFQCIRARMHAFDYADDLAFWGATKDAVPLSGKAHLNYSVMWGARGRLDIRLSESRIAADLAPRWPMAHVYLGDTLCRLHRTAEAWPHYVDGFKIAENELNLIALALQCLWDEKAIHEHEDELLQLARARPGSWLDYLVRDVLDNGEANNGVDPKYRPRGYNEGPKE